MNQPTRIPQYRRVLAGILAVLLGLGPLATPAYAAPTALADQPLNAQVLAKPNIVLTVDDSTSMLFDYLPDTVIGKYCRDMTGSMNASCGISGQNTDLSAVGRGKYVTPGFVFEQYGFPYPAYNPAFDASGPGSGCTFTPAGSATCSGGISPGALPGLDVYPNPAGPPPAKSPIAGQAYEYWTLWPAPAHNSELNHVYYNPREQYDPPLNADGTPFLQMNAGNTSNWMQVPADPWAATVQYVDLTAGVTIGQWCNSDWSVGHENDPAYCRTNGTGASAATSSTSSTDGDYNYPWAPPGINPAIGAQSTIAKAIAYSKVDSVTSAILPAWATAQDPKYFYENDNILWCDATNSLWPHGGPSIPQTCVGGSDTAQTCVGRHDQFCTPGTPQTCVGAVPQTCNGAQPQTCGALAPQACGGGAPQVCVPPATQSCVGQGPQTCDGFSSQSCNGVTPQTCANITGQTCNNVRNQVCNLAAPVCVPPNPALCTNTWEVFVDGSWVADNSNYCPCVGDECQACRPTLTCPQGKCSSDNSSCDTAATCPSVGTCSIGANVCHVSGSDPGECPQVAGTCSRDGISCHADGECANLGTCSTNTLATCTIDANCPTIPGHCSTDGNVCNVAGSDPGECPNEGHCTLTSAVCHTSGADPGECPLLPGQCSVDHGVCFDDSACVRDSHCSITGTVCTGTCPIAGATCAVDGSACDPAGAACPGASHCDLQPAVVCHTTGSDPAECPTLPGICSNSAVACSRPEDCGTLPGHCSTDIGTSCTIAANCLNTGQVCSETGEACTSTPYFPYCTWFPAAPTQCSEPSHCPIQGGTCSVDGNPCPMTGPPAYYFGAAFSYLYDLSFCPNVTVVGHCSIDVGMPCTGICPATGGPSGSAVCSDMVSDNSRSLLADANGAGVVCRHNNHTAGAYISGAYSYPNATYKTPVTAGTGANACTVSPRYATVPRHYYKTGVEWCDTSVTTPGDKWLSYGTGTCQDSQDAAHATPRFYKFGQPAGTDNYAIPAFQRMDLIPGSTYTHDWTDDNGPEEVIRAFGGATPDVSEMTNYANWFAYYRSRIQAVKTVTSASFAEIDAKYRVGFHAMFSKPSFLNIDDFDSVVQKPAWFSKLFGVTIPLGQETPTLTAVARIGDYFKNGSHPDLAGSTDPIILACQQNFHMLFTDGFTNQAALPPTTVGNVDGDNVPSTANILANPILSPVLAHPEYGIIAGQPWPRPYREDTGSPAANALSDYALYYWITDLRPGMPDNVPVSNNPPIATDRYSAKWQHLNFAALSLGTAGKLAAANQTATEAALSNPVGTLQWPQPQDIHGALNVLKPDNSGVDDLWHAAVNGHGDFVNADSIEEVKLGIGKILAGVANLPGTRASVGFVSNTFGAAANVVYRVRFEQSWSGSLAKIQIDPTTGAALPQPPLWNSADQLTNLMNPTIAKPTPWNSERRIVTMSEAGAPIPFLWGSLGPNQQDSLAQGKPAKGQVIMDFLRGSRQKEGEKVGQLRVRTGPLGDIVDSSPVYVGAPNAAYLDANDPGYSGFKSAHAGRAAQLYVGANDGMLHVFDDLTGNETWAYVPTPLFRDGSPAVSISCLATPAAVPCGTAGGDTKTGLGALAYQDGALPPFRHHYYVDLTPKIVDVDFDVPAALGDPLGGLWHTLLVGGLGKGGNRYYALDATDAAGATNEATAAARVLWEFPPVGNTAIDMGYTYGKPIIAKTRALFNGAWLAIVGSGYDNPSGVGKLYFLQASDPTHFKVMSTGVGNAGSPAGLTHPAGYTQDFHNQLAEQIYVGDLLGNFWRVDVSDPASSAWPAPGQYAKLTSPGDASPQPVTTPPEIKIDVNNGIDRWVFVGTGKLYDDTDLADSQLQTMYALRDGTSAAPWALPATPIDRTTNGCTPDPCLQPLPAADPTNNFGLLNVPAKGWYHDLPAGSRIVVAPQAAFGVIAYVATKPQTDPCLTGLPVTIYARDYGTGQSLLTTNDDGTGDIVAGIDVAAGGVGLQIVSFQAADNASSPDVRLAITMPDGTVRYFKPKLSQAFFQHRMSWRLLGQ
jgi:type IV pilus assembly protein PilY1